MTPPVWREIVATWPVPWRERWGELAGALEVEEGLGWQEAEELAFHQVDAERVAAAGGAPPRRHPDADLRPSPGREGRSQSLFAFGGTIPR